MHGTAIGLYVHLFIGSGKHLIEILLKWSCFRW